MGGKEEYEKPVQSGVIRALETQFNDPLIDISQSCVVTPARLKKIYNKINLVPGVLLTAIDKAIEYNTCICFDFDE